MISTSENRSQSLQPAIGSFWDASHGYLHFERLRTEARQQANQHPLPLSLNGWEQQAAALRTTLQQKLHLDRERPAPDPEYHGEVPLDGYTVRKVSFCSAPGIRMTGTLFIPDGPGPFPAVLNCHGHWSQGKLAARVQARGHMLARSGLVALSVDAAGAGERGETERNWTYHGASKGADLMLYGDTLLGWQVRDNQSALDFLQSLPFVDPARLGVTGASGGGNQTMWLSALDDRVKVSVPVVSVGSFESYVGRRNCICETLPSGLRITEEWGLMGLIAPRPLLILTALHDQVTFGYEAMGVTARQLQEIYTLHGHRECFDRRIIDMTHGYHPPALEAMLGWMKHWLLDHPSSTPQPLPEWTDLPEETLTCYAPDTRPVCCDYPSNRETLAEQQLGSQRIAQTTEALAQLTGWTPVISPSPWQVRRTSEAGHIFASILSPRGIPLPIVASQPLGTETTTIELILSPFGKNDTFTAQHWQEAGERGATALSVDLPGTGELAWEKDPVANCRFHDTHRACIWLGYSLTIEWAEAIAALLLTIRQQAPQACVRILADQETALAALLARKLHPFPDLDIQEFHTPESLRTSDAVPHKSTSLAWIVPGLLQWGDLNDLRKPS